MQLWNPQLEMQLTEQKLKGCKWRWGWGVSRKMVHSFHTRIILNIHLEASVPLFLCRNAESCFIAWSRLLLNAVSLKELTMSRQVHQQSCRISKCFWILRKHSSRRAETHSICNELRNWALHQQLLSSPTSVPASVFALISLLLVISERGLQIACQAVPVLICCAAELMPYYFLRKEAWWTPISRDSNQIHRRGN